jgi:hypothetical protein
MPRKPYNVKARSDAWDAPLTEEQRWRAYDKFVQFRAKWWEVAKWVAEEFGIESPSRSGLYRFWERMKRDEAGWRTRQCIDARAQAGDLAKRAGQTDADLVAAYETLAADAALQFGDADRAMLFTKMAVAVGEKMATRQGLEIKRRAQETKEETMRLAREKFEAAEARLAAARKTLENLNQSGGLTPEARAEIEKAMGML